ncbi:MAG: hypothetical protein BIFFINMI_00499 [Phycisphaerae bacterium]|nr:hypothetical protein [Phycisphaerae bacterium]
MKSEERHRLKTNELSVWISEFPGRIKKHANKLLVAVVVVLVALTVYWYLGNRDRTQQAEAWGDYWAAWSKEDAVQLESVVTRYPDTDPVTGLAELSRGVLIMRQAEAIDAAKDREKFGKHEEVAQERLDAALKRPYFGLTTPAARLLLANIAKDSGRLDDARKLYQQIIDDKQADPLFRDMASERQARLAADAGPVEFVRGVASHTEVTVPIPPPATQPESGSTEGPAPSATSQPGLTMPSGHNTGEPAPGTPDAGSGTATPSSTSLPADSGGQPDDE